MLCWGTDARTGVFLRGSGSGMACPGFPCTFFGWRFLSRMRKCITSYGRPQAASMPHRTEMGIHAHFPLGVCILLRNSRRKRSTENPGQAIPLPPPRKILPPVLGKNGVIRYSFFDIQQKPGVQPPARFLPALLCFPWRHLFKTCFKKRWYFLLGPAVGF